MLDESWFYLLTNYDFIWLTPEEPVPDRECHMIQSPKLILIVVWDTMNFDVLTALLNGIKFNMTYYTNEILEDQRIEKPYRN
jgi:hypothetical protein